MFVMLPEPTMGGSRCQGELPSTAAVVNIIALPRASVKQ
jgi:hypothetical protein